MSHIADNRKAYFNYFIIEEVEAGIVLLGTEVKALRFHKANISDAYVIEKNGELFIHNLHIPEYKWGNRINHNPKRTRKLLLHKKQIKRLAGILKNKGLTLIVLAIYFNQKNKAKLKIAVGKGKKLYDKREVIKKREWERKKNQEN